MERSKNYPRVSFDAAALRTLVDEFRSIQPDGKLKPATMTIYQERETWKYDDFEEFLSELRPTRTSSYQVFAPGSESSLYVISRPVNSLSTSEVTISHKERTFVSRIANVADEQANRCYVVEPPKKPEVIPPKPKPRIFIGHGGSAQWRDLKDHLQELHKHEVIAYETGERAGHTIRDVIEDMLDHASFAVLVMTGEDEQPDGTFRARQNVVHELGLFQGRLGFTKAVVLLEEGTQEFSNIAGVQQIRFPKTAIRQTFGDVLAVLKREFGD